MELFAEASDWETEAGGAVALAEGALEEAAAAAGAAPIENEGLLARTSLVLEALMKLTT